jgi:hypothetical protein
MSKAKNAAYDWDIIEADIRQSIFTFASMLSIAGPDDNLANAFLGVDDEFVICDIPGEIYNSFPLERHSLHSLAVRAYDYAYQLGEIDHYALEPSEPFHAESYEIMAILQGYPRADQNGDLSPFEPRLESPLRNMLETAYARYDLQQGNDLSIRQLALLSSMTLPAVRTSISKDGIKTEPVPYSKEALKTMPEEERLGRVPSENALTWLRGRRGFIPMIDPSSSARIELMWPAFLKPGADIKDGILKALKILQISVSELAQRAEVEGMWLEALFGNDLVLLDVDALKRVAKALRAPTPAFVGGMVQDILTREFQVQAADQS